MPTSDNITNCDLLGIQGIIIQALIGILSLMSLIIKRYFSQPKRKMLIFLLDVFKQLLSSSIIHLFNVIVSIILTNQQHYSEDECSSYLISFLFDVSFGVVLTYFFLRVNHRVFSKRKHWKCQQGNYILENGRICREAYMIQALMWVLITLFVKILLFLIFFSVVEYLVGLGDLILKPFSFSNVFKLFFVVIFVPVFCNVFMFFVFDQILKQKEDKDTGVLDLRYFDPIDNMDMEFNYDEIKEKLI